jgi:hypothetical protein
MRRAPLILTAALLLTACGTEDVDALDGGADAGVTPDSGTPDSGLRTPERHRPTATMCDDQRSSAPPDIPDPNPGPPYVSCTAHADCTEGANGRCIGNGHDGWYCSYDACFQDSDCTYVCLCEGGFRSDANACMQSGNCKVDADCGGGGFCSPTYGRCGDYSGTVAFYCHTAQDDCVDDTDCGGYPNYCAYDPVVGKWTCKDDHCAG